MLTAEAYKLLAMYFYGKMWAKECQVLFAQRKAGIYSCSNCLRAGQV